MNRLLLNQLLVSGRVILGDRDNLTDTYHIVKDILNDTYHYRHNIGDLVQCLEVCTVKELQEARLFAKSSLKHIVHTGRHVNGNRYTTKYIVAVPVEGEIGVYTYSYTDDLSIHGYVCTVGQYDLLRATKCRMQTLRRRGLPIKGTKRNHIALRYGEYHYVDAVAENWTYICTTEEYQEYLEHIKSTKRPSLHYIQKHLKSWPEDNPDLISLSSNGCIMASGDKGTYVVCSTDKGEHADSLWHTRAGFYNGFRTCIKDLPDKDKLDLLNHQLSGGTLQVFDGRVWVDSTILSGDLVYRKGISKEVEEIDLEIAKLKLRKKELLGE